MCGVGYHHAGLDTADRKMLETMFLSAELPVLCKWKGALCERLRNAV